MFYSKFKYPLIFVSIMAVLGAGGQDAAAVVMEVEAEVQNALTANVTTPLKFGTLVAIRSSSSGASSLEMLATNAGANLDGSVIGNDPLGPIHFLPSGGAARGVVTVTIPANSTVPYNVKLEGLQSNVNTGVNCTSTDAVLSLIPIAGYNAATDAAFNVYSWSIAPGNGTASVSPTAIVNGGKDVTATVTPSGVGASSAFYLGAKIGTECANLTYKPGVYRGLLTIDVAY